MKVYNFENWDFSFKETKQNTLNEGKFNFSSYMLKINGNEKKNGYFKIFFLHIISQLITTISRSINVERKPEINWVIIFLSFYF